jgi:hypothetical protein
MASQVNLEEQTKPANNLLPIIEDANKSPKDLSHSPSPIQETTTPPSTSPTCRDTKTKTPLPNNLDADIQQAFLHEEKATNFLSIFGRNAGISASIYHIGLRIDALAVA